MRDCSTEDRICLHLLQAEREAGASGVRTEALLDGLGVGERAITGHFGVISGLSDLEERGFVETRSVAVAGDDERRTAYELTDAGREHARDLADDLADRTVTVRTAEERSEMRLDAVADRLDGSLAEAVARLRNGVVVLDEDVTGPVDAESMPFVGREAALGWLDERFDLARARANDTGRPEPERSETVEPESPEPDVVRVEGEAGVGKTSLATEFGGRVADRGGVFLFGECDPETERPYGPVLDAVADLPEPERDRVRALLTAVDDPSADGTATAGAGGASAETETGDGSAETETGDGSAETETGDGSAETETGDGSADPGANGAPSGPETPDELAERRAALFADVASELATVTADRPVVLALDDAQWVDRPTALLVAHLADELAAEPFLAVATSYPAADGAGGELSAAFDETGLGPETYTLDPFDRDATTELVARLAGTRRVPESFVERVHEHTGGNPLFVAESVTSMLESGAVQPDAGVFPDADASGDWPVPETVEAAIAARLDGLDNRTRTLLETAAIVGSVVPEDVLEAASTLSPAAFRQRVTVLVESRLWTRADDETVRFVSDVVRETVREGVPADRRRDVHRRVADAYDDRADRPAAATRAARHYARAGAAERAVETAIDAAADAIAVYAHEVAIEACERAVDLARETGDDAVVVEALELLGDTYETTGEFDEATRCYQFVRERTQDPGTVQQMWTREGRIGTKTGAFDRARECFERALAVHEESDRDAPAELADTRHNLAIVAVKRGEFETAREEFAAVVERYRDLGEEVDAARTLGNLGVVERRLGDYEAARDAHRRSLAVFRDHDETNDAANALGNLGILAMKRGDLERARERYRECLERKREIDEPRGQSRAHENLGTVELLAGNPERAREHYRETVETGADIGDRHVRAQGRQGLGTVERTAGDYDAARAHYRRALETYRELGDRSREAETLGEFGVLSWREGDAETAASYLEDCLDAFEETGETVDRNEYLGVLGAVEVSRGNAAAGREKRDEALAALDGADNPLAEVTVLRHHVEVELASGDREQARDLCERAREAIDDADADLGAERDRVRSLCDRVADGE